MAKKRRGPVRPKVYEKPSVKTREVRGEATSGENLGARGVQSGAGQGEGVVEGRDMRKELVEIEGRDVRKELIHKMKVAFEGRDVRKEVVHEGTGTVLRVRWCPR